MNAIFEPPVAETNRALQEIVQSACKRIAPLWPLKNFVAVNPFVGLSDRPFMDAARLMLAVGHGEMLMPAGFYQEQIASGRIQEKDLRAAVCLASKTLPAGWAEHIEFAGLNELHLALASSRPPASADRVLTFADFLDEQSGSNWSAFVLEEISKWCSAYYDQGQSSWRMPWRGLGLFEGWKAAAQLDLNPELSGLNRFREFVESLPADYIEVVERALGKLDVPEKGQSDFLHRQFMSIAGWSSYVQFLVRERGMVGEIDDSLTQLLAIRLAYDMALHDQFGAEPKVLQAWRKETSRRPNPRLNFSPDLLTRYIAQQALECGYQRELIAKLKSQVPVPAVRGQKSLQAIFCIDVRSEVFRRSLEDQSQEIETIGFAGFFGMPIEYLKLGQARGGAQCPVLLTPKFKIREALQGGDAGSQGRLLRRMNLRQTVNGSWNSFKSSAISCFSFVETAGLWFGLKLAKDSLALAVPDSSFGARTGRHRLGPTLERESRVACNQGHSLETGIDLSDQIELAANALKNMGLTSDFAKVVLLCGHGSATANNPYGSALDCGACGGHAGEANARIAAAILNKLEVRAGLVKHGIQIPEESTFIAGLHNTTTDEIVIYDTDSFSANRLTELGKIKAWLRAASKQARRERAASLGLADLPEDELERQIFKRSRDWSQVRPEWGLAGNAAFIAAPRERTEGLNLGGRVFLHDYDSSRDKEASILELIMVAPMVVASWINLQYYGSTVDNERFGSGNKVVHNVVGTFGVWQGNGGDLRPGLPLQSVHDGRRWMHEPLRLNVFIQAERGAIQKVIAAQPGVRELIENGWVTLFAMDASGKRFWRHCTNGFTEEGS